ncbi:MAG: hypothetical protein KAI40_01220 [Desulfobacterales bacterium]|nr:hypothetical protein [Desulfobacterales bacterium]
MKILFIGTVQFSFDALESILKEGGNVVAVITQDKAGINSDFKEIEPLCEKNKIPCMKTDNINSSKVQSWVKNFAPDLAFCFGWSQLIKMELMSLIPMGIVGFHPALLPKNRGRHPLIWALILDKMEFTGATFFFMDEGADTGDILSQKRVPIFYEDKAIDLYSRVTEQALKQIKEFLPKLQKGTYRRIVQDNSTTNTWRKRTKKDGLIDFRMPSRAIYKLVRALSFPYVGAHVEYKGQEIKIWVAREVSDGYSNIELDIEPGKIIDVKDNGIVIKCYDNAIWIDSSEFASLPLIGEYL